MRILFWAELYAPCIGGIETVVSLLAEELVRHGHEAIVVTNLAPAGLPATEVIRGVPVHRFNMTRAMQDKNFGELRRACTAVLALKRAFAPDLEHMHSSGPVMLVQQIVQRDCPTPLISSLHCTHDLMAGLIQSGGAARAVLHDSSRIITPSEILATTVRQALPLLANRLLIEPYGVPALDRNPEPLPFAPPVALGCGRLVREKGFDLALRAFADLRSEAPDLHLVIAGDGAERPILQALAAELGLAGRVEFTGWVKPADLSALIGRVTFVLLPSRWQEPFAIVALESAKMGRPVITSDVGGMKESVSHGLTGLVVENENPAALANAMRELLTDPERTRRMGAAARARSLDRFTFERYFNTHLKLYRETIAVRPA